LQKKHSSKKEKEGGDRGNGRSKPAAPPKAQTIDIQGKFDHALSHEISVIEMMYMKDEFAEEDRKMEILRHQSQEQ